MLWIKHNIQTITLITRMLYSVILIVPMVAFFYKFEVLTGVQFWLPVIIIFIVDISTLLTALLLSFKSERVVNMQTKK
jgi:hypothetical protein